MKKEEVDEIFKSVISCFVEGFGVDEAINKIIEDEKGCDSP
jgi:hypothetical protein